MKINFIRKLVLILIILSCTYNQPIQAKDLASSQKISEITIDGNLDDWSGISASFDKDKEISLAVCNDSDNLYIKMHTQNDANVRAIKMTGIKVYIDNGKGSKKDFYIKFTGGPDLKHPVRENQSNFPEESRELKSPKDLFICFDKNRMLHKVIPVDGTEGPAAAFGEMNQVYIYEFKIPMHKSTTNSYGIEITPGKKFKIGLVWGDKDDLPERLKSKESGRIDGGSGFGPPSRSGKGGGRGGGMRSGKKQTGRLRIDKKEVWVNTVLASATKQEE